MESCKDNWEKINCFIGADFCSVEDVKKARQAVGLSVDEARKERKIKHEKVKEWFLNGKMWCE